MKLMNKLGRMLMVTAVLAGVTAGGLSSVEAAKNRRNCCPVKASPSPRA